MSPKLDSGAVRPWNHWRFSLPRVVLQCCPTAALHSVSAAIPWPGPSGSRCAVRGQARISNCPQFETAPLNNHPSGPVRPNHLAPPVARPRPWRSSAVVARPPRFGFRAWPAPRGRFARSGHPLRHAGPEPPPSISSPSPVRFTILRGDIAAAGNRSSPRRPGTAKSPAVPAGPPNRPRQERPKRQCLLGSADENGPPTVWPKEVPPKRVPQKSTMV